MTALWIVAAIFLTGFIGICGLILLVVLTVWRDRDQPRETLYLTAAADDDPALAWKLAEAVRRYEAGARG